MVFFDTIPNSTSLVTGSVYINNVNYPLSNPAPPGIYLNNVSIGQVMTISFDVIIASLPNPPTLLNNCQLTYTYTPIPSLPKLYGSVISNNVITTVYHASLKNFTKFVDTLPNGSIFVPNAVMVNVIC